MLTSTNSSIKPNVVWAAPSNIALVKYWGKKGFQLPANSSISLSLSKAYTETALFWKEKSGSDLEFQFLFNGKENKKFFEKMQSVMMNFHKELPFLSEYKLKIESKNTFPHSVGIASSASSMASLALCLCEMERKILNQDNDFFNRASYLARIGSGSASRSIYGEFSQWGEIHGIGSDLYAQKIVSYHPIFKGMKDTILIVSNDEKKLSSTQGHKLMDEHTRSKERYFQANNNFLKMLENLKSGDLKSFGKILEEEALSLHSHIINSTKGEIILLKANSLEIMEKVRDFRERKKLDLYFTLDAGPNVHLLYPKCQELEVNNFIEGELLPFCISYIPDEMGNGPWRVS